MSCPNCNDASYLKSEQLRRLSPSGCARVKYRVSVASTGEQIAIEVQPVEPVAIIRDHPRSSKSPSCRSGTAISRVVLAAHLSGAGWHAISGRSQPTDHQLEKVKPHVRTHPRIAAGLTDRERNTGNSHPPKTKAKRSNGDVVPSALLVAEHKNCRDKANGHNHCH